MTLSQYFRLVDLQAWMALRSDASRLVLGYIWWVLEPLLYVAVFYVVFDIILESKRDDFLVFLMCGKLAFIWFTRSVNQAAGSIVANAGLIGRIDVPKSLFPMAQVQLNFYKQSLVFLLLLVVLLAAGFMPTWAWLWIIPVIAVEYLLITACSLIGAVLVCYVRDFAMVISLGTVFLMFSSGIFWDVRGLEDERMTELILMTNPVAFLLDAYRQVLMYNTRPDLLHLVVLAAICGVVIWLTILYMRRNSQQLALRALS
jgi:lipopolysaccharide transport system permease protein